MRDRRRRGLAESSGLGWQIVVSTVVFIAAMLLPGIIFGGSQFFTALFDRSLPAVGFVDPPSGIGIEPTTLTFDVRDSGTGLAEVSVRVVENRSGRQVFYRKYPDNTRVSKDSISISFDGANSGYSQGQITVVVEVADRSLWQNKGVASLLLKVDYDSPTLEILSSSFTGAPGSVHLLFYKARDRQLDFSGVQHGGEFFPGYKAMLLDPAFGDMDNVFFSLFPTSLLCEKRPCQPELLAVDSVGNQTVGDVGLRLRAKARTPRIIEYTGEKFLSRVNDLYLEYLQTMQIGLDDSIDISPATEQFAYRFQKLNEDYRDYIDQGLLQGFRKTEGNRYWRGPLLSYAGDLIVGFGDSQLFKLNGITAGKFQSRGVTWTNLKDDKIRAANTGKVVFTGSNGVYGNAVVIDHGFGLSSFYAHLDTILVRVGDKVSKSTVIGRAGTSGLMAQQSLHFQLRLHGVPIDPSPWWNTSWVRREIDRKLSSIKRKLGISGFSVLHGFGP